MRTTAKGEEPSLAFGGQAVIDGVMFRSKKHVVICVRRPNGEILTNTEEVRSVSERYSFLKLPLIRGIVALLETLYLGVKGLYFSANVSLEEEGEKIEPKEMAVTFALALALAIFLFSVVPFFITDFLTSTTKITGVLFNVIEGSIRIAIFLIYLVAVATVHEFKRVLQYHGAEHVVINAYEDGAKLNVTNAKKYPRLHPRCGTSFILIVLITSILLFSLIPGRDFITRLSYRVTLIPLISAISYEVLKISDLYKKSTAMKVLVAPGLVLQRLTTRKPDDTMIAVALQAVREMNKLSQT